MSKPTDVPESTKLLPCPFCGQQPPINRAMSMGGWLIECCKGMASEPTRENTIAAWNQRTPAASPVAPPESTRSLAELLTDFVIAHGNKYSPLRDTPEIQAALTVSKEAYETHRVHDFTTAHRESIIAGLANLLASPVAGGSASNYIADREQAPQWVAFANGRTVGIAFPKGQRPHLVIGWEQPGERRLRSLGAAEDDAGCVNIGDPKLVPEGWVKVTPETMPAYDDQSETVYVSDGSYVGTAIMEDYHTNAAYFRTSGMTHFKLIPLPAPPAAEEERSSL